jgi:hypothetical protein
MVSILPYVHMVSTLIYPDVDPPTTAMWILHVDLVESMN